MASRTKKGFETYAFACYQNETDAYRSNAQTADLMSSATIVRPNTVK